MHLFGACFFLADNVFTCLLYWIIEFTDSVQLVPEESVPK